MLHGTDTAEKQNVARTEQCQPLHVAGEKRSKYEEPGKEKTKRIQNLELTE